MFMNHYYIFDGKHVRIDKLLFYIDGDLYFSYIKNKSIAILMLALTNLGF